MKRLNELLVGGLADYNIRVVTPATTKPRDFQKEWIERGLRESHAVLLVCNRQFQEEWEGRSSGGEHGDLMVASVVKVRLLLHDTFGDYWQPDNGLNYSLCVYHTYTAMTKLVYKNHYIAYTRPEFAIWLATF